MTDRRALLAVAIAGVAIFALSFVNGWIFLDREVRGEGFRHSEILLSAWRSVAIPVLSLAAIIAAATAVAAIVILSETGRPAALAPRRRGGGRRGARCLVARPVELGRLHHQRRPASGPPHGGRADPRGGHARRRVDGGRDRPRRRGSDRHRGPRRGRRGGGRPVGGPHRRWSEQPGVGGRHVRPLGRRRGAAHPDDRGGNVPDRRPLVRCMGGQRRLDDRDRRRPGLPGLARRVSRPRGGRG